MQIIYILGLYYHHAKGKIAYESYFVSIIEKTTYRINVNVWFLLITLFLLKCFSNTVLVFAYIINSLIIELVLIESYWTSPILLSS